MTLIVIESQLYKQALLQLESETCTICVRMLLQQDLVVLALVLQAMLFECLSEVSAAAPAAATNKTAATAAPASKPAPTNVSTAKKTVNSTASSKNGTVAKASNTTTAKGNSSGSAGSTLGAGAKATGNATKGNTSASAAPKAAASKSPAKDAARFGVGGMNAWNFDLRRCATGCEQNSVSSILLWLIGLCRRFVIPEISTSPHLLQQQQQLLLLPLLTTTARWTSYVQDVPVWSLQAA